MPAPIQIKWASKFDQVFRQTHPVPIYFEVHSKTMRRGDLANVYRDTTCFP
jgi:hypothetical protein